MIIVADNLYQQEEKAELQKTIDNKIRRHKYIMDDLLSLDNAPNGVKWTLGYNLKMNIDNEDFFTNPQVTNPVAVGLQLEEE